MENYKSVEPPDQEKQICGVIKDRNDTRTIAFVNKPPNARRIARKKSHNVLSSNRELQKQQKNSETKLEHSKLFIKLIKLLKMYCTTLTQKLLKRLLNFRKILMKIGCIPAKRISIDELTVYLGPLYYRDL